jgi:hypothetical protein
LLETTTKCWGKCLEVAKWKQLENI